MMTKYLYLIIFSFVFGSQIFSANPNRPKTEFFSFAGALKKDGDRFSGYVRFKFAIVDPHEVVLWSSDGTKTAPPFSSIKAEIIDTKYAVRIGDESIDNMAPLDPELGKQRNLFLQVWVSSKVDEEGNFIGVDSDFEHLTPDMPFGTVPRAFAANSIDGVEIGEIVQTAGATMEGTLDMNDNRITGLPTPTDMDEAATKEFILSSIADALSSTSELTIKKISSSDGFCVTKADGTVIFKVDSSGNVESHKFIGDGSGLTNLNIGAVTVDSSKITDGSITGADLASSTITDDKLAQITAANKVAASAVEDKFLRNDGDDSTTGSITATAFIGDGSGLTNLNTNSIGDKFIKNDENDTMNGNLSVSGNVTANKFIGDGSSLTNLNVGSVSVDSSSITDGSITGDDIANATISDIKLNQITTANKVAASAVEDKFIRNDDNDSTTGSITATAFIGDGSGLTNLNIGNIAVDSSKITDGSILDADISSSASISDDKLAQLTTANKVLASAVEDKFLRNDGDDTSTGTILANGFSTTGLVSSGNVTATGNVTSGFFFGDGSGLINLNIGSVTVDSSSISDDSITNADINSSASIVDSKLAQITTADKVSASAVEDKFLRNDGDDTTSGVITASGFAGDGSGLIGLRASSLTSTNSDSITFGGNVVFSGNVQFTGSLESSQVSSVGISSVFEIPYLLSEHAFVLPSGNIADFSLNGQKSSLMYMYSKSGELLWSKVIAQEGGPGGLATISDVSYDGNSSIVICGHFTNQFDFDPNGVGKLITGVDYGDMFITKLSIEGVWSWTKTYGGHDYSGAGFLYQDQVTSICENDDGSFFITGRIGDSTVNFGGFSLTNIGTLYSSFIAKLDSSGVGVWGRRFAHNIRFSESVCSGGNVYAAGTFSNTADFDPDGLGDSKTSSGKDDCLLIGFDSNGNKLWVNTWGGTEYEHVDVLVNDKEHLYYGGGYNSTVDFNSGSGNLDVTSFGLEDLFISKFSMSGNWVWTNTIGSPGHDRGLELHLKNGSVCAVAFIEGIKTKFYSGSNDYRLNAGKATSVIYFSSTGEKVSSRYFDTVQGLGLSNNYPIGSDLNLDNEIVLWGFFDHHMNLDSGKQAVDIYWDGDGYYLLKIFE